MIKNFNLKLILLECFALTFVISGNIRFFVAYHGEKFDAIAKQNWEKFDSLIDGKIGQLFAYQAYWHLGILVISILLVVLLNWLNKFAFINSIGVLILTLGISATGFYKSGVINRSLNNFCGIFAEKHGISFLIGGLILSFIGILILWITIDSVKNESIKKHERQ